MIKINLLKIYYFYFNNKNIILKHFITSSVCASSELIFFILFYNNLNLILFWSHFLSFIIATSFGYIGHSFFTFKIGYLNKKNLILFISQAIIALTIGYMLLYIFINFLHIGSTISKMLQLCLIFNFNFIYGKFISFKKR